MKIEIFGGPEDGGVMEIPEELSWHGGILELEGHQYVVNRRKGTRIRLHYVERKHPSGG